MPVRLERTQGLGQAELAVLAVVEGVKYYQGRAAKRKAQAEYERQRRLAQKRTRQALQAGQLNEETDLALEMARAAQGLPSAFETPEEAQQRIIGEVTTAGFGVLGWVVLIGVGLAVLRG